MIPKHHRFIVPCVVLVVTAITIPTASARTVTPNPDEIGLIAAQHATQALAVRPNPDEIGLIAASQPNQLAALAPVRPNPDEIGSGPRSLSAQQLTALTGPQVVQAESNPGFDWGDAGIGAGAALALTVGIGAAAMLNRRRHRQATAA